MPENQRRLGAVAGSVAAALLLAGCGGAATVTVTDGPAPNASATAPPSGGDDPVQVVGGQVTAAPGVSTPRETPRQRIADRQNALGCPPEPVIPEGVDFEDLQNSGLDDAADLVQRRYDTYEAGASGRYWTGISVCPFAGIFTVYRVPGGKKFDAWISGVARKHGVKVRFVDRKYSLATLEGVRADVMSRQDELAKVDAMVVTTVPEYVEGCFIEAGVSGDVEAARRVLADLGDKVMVVEGRALEAA